MRAANGRDNRAEDQSPVEPAESERVQAGRELVRLANVVVRLEEQSLSRLALSYRQMRILKHLHEGVDSATELGRRFGITAPAVSETVEALVQKGLVRRSPNPADRRSVQLTLTASGLAAHRRAQRSEDRLAEDVLRWLTDAEVARLRQLLEKTVDQNQEVLFSLRKKGK